MHMSRLAAIHVCCAVLCCAVLCCAVLLLSFLSTLPHLSPLPPLHPKRNKPIYQGDADLALEHARTVVALERAYLAATAKPTDGGSGSGGGGGSGGSHARAQAVAVSSAAAAAPPAAAQQAAPPKVVLRIRNYQPVLLALALAGRRGDALKVEQEMAAMKKEILDLSGEKF